jgi:hypothetical protein
MKFPRRFVSPVLIFSALFALTASTVFASGATWTQHTEVGQFFWFGLASSADGTKLAAAADENAASEPGYIWTSTDGGATWTPRTAAGLRKWSTITSSADGTRLAAAPNAALPVMSIIFMLQAMAASLGHRGPARERNIGLASRLPPTE